jgi:hypothetical protein
VTTLGASHRVKEHRCLRCDAVLDTATTVVDGDGDQLPKRGDVSICLTCNHVAIFTRGGKLREPRPDELRAVMADQTVTTARNALSLLHADRKRRSH